MENRDILNLMGERKYPVDSELKVHNGLYNSKSTLYINNLCVFSVTTGSPLDKTAVNKMLSVSDWNVLSLTCRYGKVRKAGGLSIKHWTNPRRNLFITLCSLGAFLIWKNWIIHKRRGLVSVVNSIGVSPLSVAEVIFSPSVTDGAESLNPWWV